MSDADNYPFYDRVFDRCTEAISNTAVRTVGFLASYLTSTMTVELADDVFDRAPALSHGINALAVGLGVTAISKLNLLNQDMTRFATLTGIALGTSSHLAEIAHPIAAIAAGAIATDLTRAVFSRQSTTD